MVTLIVMAKRANTDWDTYTRELGVRVRRLRDRRGLTQQDVLFATGISRTTYQRVERGQTEDGRIFTPTLKVVVALAQAFDVELDELIPKPWPDFRVR